MDISKPKIYYFYWSPNHHEDMQPQKHLDLKSARQQMAYWAALGYGEGGKIIKATVTFEEVDD